MNPHATVNTGTWMALLYAASAAVCLLADHLSALSRHSALLGLTPWRWYALALLAMATSSILQIDVAFVLWARDAAQAGGWYAMRRPLQMAVLLALLAGSGLLIQRVLRDYWPPFQRSAARASAIAALGLLVLVGLLALRIVSLHFTDQALDWRLAGFRAGRLAELAGLSLVTAGGIRQLRLGP